MQGIDKGNGQHGPQRVRPCSANRCDQRVGRTRAAATRRSSSARVAEVFLNRKQGAAKGAVKWAPWQLRMSQRTYHEIMEARTARTLRTEAQLISAALFDDTPHQSIDKGYLNPAWVSKTQRVFSNAIAMRGGAHLCAPRL